MNFLTLKVPPVLLMTLFATVMWVLTIYTGNINIALNIRGSLFILSLVIAVLLALAGVIEFKRARTTVNPTAPESTSDLVCTGIYRYTRNPMYLGFFIALLGWGFFLANPYACVFTCLFVPYMNKFQITPEERVLAKLFGQQYLEYCQQVRRWC